MNHEVPAHSLRAERDLRLMFAQVVLAVVLALSSGLWARPVRADDLTRFEAARALYDNQEYQKAVDALRELVGTDPPSIRDPLLVLESRKYLAASLLFIGAKEDAKLQFRALLAQEPDYALDPLAFPTEVLDLFDAVKAELQRQVAEQRKQQEAARQEAELRAQREENVRRENVARLTTLAKTAEVREANSRFIASIPFGVGQFQNGHKGLGVVLAMAEGLAASASVISFIGHQGLVNDDPSSADIDDARRRERVWRTTNYVSFGVFAGLALIGILDAHLRFVPERVRTRERPLPPDLEEWMGEQGLSSGKKAPGPRL